MFEFVRKHTKIFMFLMFLPMMGLVLGNVDWQQLVRGGPDVAKVAGKSITQEEWDFAHRAEAERIRASSPKVDPKLLDSPEVRYMTLEKLVRDRVIAQDIEDQRISTSDARLARELLQLPAIAALRKPDGSLDQERYRQLAQMQGLTPAGLEARIRNALTLRQAEGGITDSAFASASQVKQALNAWLERREVQVALLTPADYVGKIHPTDAELQAWYQANTAKFQSPETADVEYLVLDMEAVKKSISISEADVRDYYDKNAAQLSGKAERRASHILITAGKDLPADQREKAKQKAQALLEQVRKTPDAFADIARKESQDPGSKDNGGDLGFFGRGAMVKAFEDAVFGMKKGETSGVVESDYGYHIIKLTDTKEPEVKKFEELKPQIEADLRTAKAKEKFNEYAEMFTNVVGDQIDSLKPTADKLKLNIQTANGVQRTPAPGAKGPLSNPKLLAALFKPETLEKKRNTEVVELGTNILAAAHVTAWSPARQLTFDEARTNVLAQLTASRALDMAKADGAEKLKAWKAQPAQATNLQAPVLISRDEPQNFPPAVLSASLRADTASLPAFVGVDLGKMGYAIVRVNKVQERTPPEAEAAKQERAQFTQALSSAEAQAYYELLKTRYKVQIKVPKPAKTAETSPAPAE